MKLKLDRISTDGGTQPRENIDEQIVSEYAISMMEGDSFPDVVVFNDGAKYWLADGFHRYHASKKLGYLEINATIESGTKRDAVLYSVSANSKHGLRRSNADKKKAVLTLLNDEEWSQWSDNEISKKCEVSQPTVSKYRKEVESSYKDYKIESSRKVKRGDQEYTVDTSNIGKDKNSDHIDKNENLSDEEEGKIFKGRKGIGLEKAHEAISKLKQIPPNDGLLQEAYETVIQWINNNR